MAYHQAGLARVDFNAINRQHEELRALKPLEILVVRPEPTLVDFDASPRILRVGCVLDLPADAKDVRPESNQRPVHNGNYLQTFAWSLFRKRIASSASFSSVSASSVTFPEAGAVLQGSHEGQEELPLDFPGVTVAGSCHMMSKAMVRVSIPCSLTARNQHGGMSSRFSWAPERGQEGRQYVACVRVEDACKSGPPVMRCVDLTVLKCQACLRLDDSLQSLAAHYKTDFLSLYTSNIHLESPDDNPVGTPINIGLMYKVKEGDSMSGVATRFFTTVEHLLEVNADIANRSGILTPFSRAGDVTLGPRHSLSPAALTSDKLPAFHSFLLLPGEEVCVVPPVCDVRCDIGSVCTFSGDIRASGGLLT
jgi:hypothetical protein